ncbi:hypothetical protein [Zoogloea sp. 1C4]|uniref:hypothetical protein n=1 Tax=Zoogloea sp. 1C4 TaxID=2570190 RepID=UPI001291EE63|nr:hypothetical protein [Zoogloea sp. 1C4]
MTTEIKVTLIRNAEGLQRLRNALPGLRAMSDDEAVEALADLYELGFSGGAEVGENVMKEMGLWLSRLVVAHTKQDPLEVGRILDEFVAARCIVKESPSPTQQP